MIHSHELHDCPLNHSQTQPLCYWPKLTSGSVTKLQERLKFKIVLRKKSKEIPSAHKPEKNQGSHSPVPLSEPPIYVWRCQGLLKKRQKAYCVEELRRTKTQSGRRDSQPILTKFSSNHSSSSCLSASSPKIQDILQQNTMQNSTKDDQVSTKCNSCVLGSIRRVPATTAYGRIPSWMKTNTIVIHSENDEKG
jgi:hypothetical protein